MTDASDGERAASAPRGILGWAVLATILAAAIAAGVAILLGDETATTQDYRTRGSEYADLVDVVLMLAICAAVTIGVWIAFQLLFFRQRAKLWKSIVALLMMAVVVTLAGFIARAGTLVSHFEQDREALRQIRSGLNEQLSAMRTEADEAGHELQANAGLPEINNEAGIGEALAAIRAQRERIRAFEAAADAAISRAREDMLALDVYEGERLEFLAQIGAILASDSATHRLFDLETALLDKQEEAVLLMQQRRTTWSFYRGEVQFHDRDAVNDMNELMREAHEIMRQIDLIAASGGEGVPRPTPPPP